MPCDPLTACNCHPFCQDIHLPSHRRKHLPVLIRQLLYVPFQNPPLLPIEQSANIDQLPPIANDRWFNTFQNWDSDFQPRSSLLSLLLNQPTNQAPSNPLFPTLQLRHVRHRHQTTPRLWRDPQSESDHVRQRNWIHHRQRRRDDQLHQGGVG